MNSTLHIISEVPGCDIWEKTSTRWVDLSLELQRVLWAIDGDSESSLFSGYRGSLKKEMTYQIRDSFASGRKSSSKWLKQKGKLLAQGAVEFGSVSGFGHGFRTQGISLGLIFLPPLVSGCPLLMASGSHMVQSSVPPSSLSSSPVMFHEPIGSEGVGI